MSKEMKSAGLLFTIAERIGQGGCFLLPVMSKDYFDKASFASVWLILLVVCILAYLLLWVRYYSKGREFSLLFAPFWFVPVPMAVFPILAFAFTAIWIKSVWIGIAVLIFAAGHIPNSLKSYNSVK